MMAPPRILVIEDEPGVRLAVKDELEFEGYHVELADNGAAGLAAILRSPPELVVLDVMLPGENGFEICRKVRSQGLRTPIIMITARSQEIDKVRGLDLGADDYITKPFGLAELVARVRAVLRRSADAKPGGVLVVQDLRVEVSSRRAFKGGTELQLTDTEFRILVLLLERAGEVITRDEFLDTVWGKDVYVSHRTVDTHVASLRKKIEDDLLHPAYISSVRNVGYRFNTTRATS
jgi:DNA-binding response OmpR family regulator